MPSVSSQKSSGDKFQIVSESLQYEPVVEALYDDAFGPGRFARTAERLREGNHCLSSLSRLAFDTDGSLAAAVRVWPVNIGGQAGAVFVGPVAVASAYRGNLLGLKLVEHCLVAARQAGQKMALLIGPDNYFAKIGFSRVAQGTLEMPGFVPEGRLLMMALDEKDMPSLSGRVTVPHVSRPEA